jgi:hypothetical protein
VNRLNQTSDPGNLADIIFQAMLTGKPTAAERNLLSREIETWGKDVAKESLVRAVLNTRQFLFIEQAPSGSQHLKLKE